MSFVVFILYDIYTFIQIFRYSTYNTIYIICLVFATGSSVSTSFGVVCKREKLPNKFEEPKLKSIKVCFAKTTTFSRLALGPADVATRRIQWSRKVRCF